MSKILHIPTVDSHIIIKNSKERNTAGLHCLFRIYVSCAGFQGNSPCLVFVLINIFIATQFCLRLIVVFSVRISMCLASKKQKKKNTIDNTFNMRIVFLFHVVHCFCLSSIIHLWYAFISFFTFSCLIFWLRIIIIRHVLNIFFSFHFSITATKPRLWQNYTRHSIIYMVFTWTLST